MCSLCPTDHRDLNLYSIYPDVPREEVDKWFEARKWEEEAAMLREFQGLPGTGRLSLQSYAIVVGSRTILNMNMRNNEIMDHVTGKMWVAPKGLELKKSSDDEEEDD